MLEDITGPLTCAERGYVRGSCLEDKGFLELELLVPLDEGVFARVCPGAPQGMNQGGGQGGFSSPPTSTASI